MAVPLRRGFFISGSNGVGVVEKKPSPMAGASSEFSAWKSEFKGKHVVVGDQTASDGWVSKDHADLSKHAQVETSICAPRRALRWWRKSIMPNMVEINSAKELVDSLLSAGDKLVIVDFYSPACGGCRALHPKICQFAESNPDALFLKVNYEEHKSMCCSLNIHVLPFFRFYRGAQGRVCSFSCTNATIKKFKDAVAKHGTESCSLGPAKGLEESELANLASNKEIQFSYPLITATAIKPALNKFAGTSVGMTEQEEQMAAALGV